MLQLVLRKLGFTGGEIAAMPKGEALAWLEANRELNNPAPKKTYKILRKKPHG
jgi:hypothetical protein